jgi:(R,R)-butanediol dehydrogenase/meso-butanediol dehydrogenase/diacetyl reductase
MKAAYYEGNKRIRIGDCEPRRPGRDEVRLQVSYCGICGTDLHVFHGNMDHRVKMPQVIGHEMSGHIAEIGDGVKGFNVGEAVVVRPLDACGDCPACRAGHSHICHNLNFIGIDSPGALQGSWTVPADTLHRLPEGFDMRLGALIEPLAVACHDVRLGAIEAGEQVVVLGGGPIGLLVGLVARSKGAEVVISEPQEFRRGLSTEMGITSVDPTKEDLVAYVEEKTGGAGADAVFEVSGAQAGAEAMTQILRTRGRIILVAIFPKPTPVDLFRFFWRELRLLGARVYEAQDFEEAIALADSGELPLERLITTVEPLDNTMGAFESIASDPKAMKVLIQCSEA